MLSSLLSFYELREGMSPGTHLSSPRDGDVDEKVDWDHRHGVDVVRSAYARSVAAAMTAPAAQTPSFADVANMV